MLASPPPPLLPKISYVVHAISVKWQQEGLLGSPLELLLLSLLLLTFSHWAMQRTLSNFCCLLPPRPIVLQRHKKRISAKYSPQGVYQEILSLGMIFPDMLPRKYDLCHPISSTKHCCRVEKDDKCVKENFRNMIRVVATSASFWVQRRFIQGMRLRRSDQPHSVSVGWRCEKSTRTDFPEVIEWMWGPGNYVNTSWMQSLPDQEEFMSVVKLAWVGRRRTHRQHDHHRQLSCREVTGGQGFSRSWIISVEMIKSSPSEARCLWRVLTKLWSSK